MKTKLAKIYSKFILSALSIAAICSGCCTGKAPGVHSSVQGYTPLDMLPIDWIRTSDNHALELSDLNSELSTYKQRETDGSGKITYGPASFGAAGTNYSVIYDWIKFSPYWFAVTVTKDPAGKVTALDPVATGGTPTTYIPVYVGVGVRLTADFSVGQGTLDLGSLTAIGANASVNHITGGLSINMMGISGTAITPFVSNPGDISPNSIQTALVSMGSAKAKVYDSTAGDVVATPMIVGCDNLIGADLGLLRQFIANVAAKKPVDHVILPKGPIAVQ